MTKLPAPRTWVEEMQEPLEDCESCRHWYPRENRSVFVGDCRNPISPAFEKHCWGTDTCELWEQWEGDC